MFFFYFHSQLTVAGDVLIANVYDHRFDHSLRRRRSRLLVVELVAICLDVDLDGIFLDVDLVELFLVLDVDLVVMFLDVDVVFLVLDVGDVLAANVLVQSSGFFLVAGFLVGDWIAVVFLFRAIGFLAVSRGRFGCPLRPVLLDFQLEAVTIACDK
jgi:hypothetical protein